MKSIYDKIELKRAEPVANFDEWRGVWVIAEILDGKVRDVTRELLGAGKEMAEKLDVKLTAIALGHELGNIPQELAEYGAEEVITIDHIALKTPLARPSADALTAIINKYKPEVVLIGATHTGRDISSRIAVYVEAGMTADCTELDVEPSSRELLARRPAFGGKMLATIRCDRHRPQMATARPGIFIPLERNKGAKAKIIKESVKLLDERSYHAEVLDFVFHHGADITKEEVLVGGGMGVGQAGFEKLRELAEALGGEVACSRPVADAGWLERSRQIGQTGVSVRPKLYVAVGISGAIQHIEGMKEAGTVIAINNDPHAPIFQYADIGLVGDWRAHVDALIAAAKAKNLNAAKWMVPKKDTLQDDRDAASERAVKSGKAVAPAPAAKPATAKETTKAEAPKSKPAEPVKAEAPAIAEDKPVTAKAPAPEPATAANDGVFTGNPSDVAEVKAFAKKLPESMKAWVLGEDCIVCNGCEAACPTGAAVVTDTARVNRDLCVSDGGCIDACPTGAIRLGVEDKATSTGWPA